MTNDHEARSLVGYAAVAAAALTHNDDVSSILANLLGDCASALSAGATGIMVVVPDRNTPDAGTVDSNTPPTSRRPHTTIEVLSASSHEALELELYQSQIGSGPCLESIAADASISVTSSSEIRERWPDFGAALAASGYHSAHAYPMSWQGQVIGGLNIFRSVQEPLDDDQSLLAQTFADIATVAIVHAGHTTADLALARTRSALAARNLIEQAKGVLAYQRQLDMATAYAELLTQAESSGRSLSDTAAAIMRSASRR